MVSLAMLYRTSAHLGRLYTLAAPVVLAISAGLLLAVYRETRMILYVLNGGCIR